MKSETEFAHDPINFRRELILLGRVRILLARDLIFV